MPRLLRQLREQFSKLESRRDRAVKALEDSPDSELREERKQLIAELTSEMLSYDRALKLNYEPERGEFGGRLVEVELRVEAAGEIIVLDFDEETPTGVFTRTGTEN